MLTGIEAMCSEDISRLNHVIFLLNFKYTKNSALLIFK